MDEKKVKEVMMSKMPMHWKEEWRQLIMTMLEQIVVTRDEKQSKFSADFSYNLSFRHVPEVVINFGEDIRLIIKGHSVENNTMGDLFRISRNLLGLNDCKDCKDSKDCKASKHACTHFDHTRDASKRSEDFKGLPLNLWCSLIFHVAEYHCKEQSNHLHLKNFEPVELDETMKLDSVLNYNHQFWLPAQHYLKPLFATEFPHAKPDEWFPSVTPDWYDRFSLDGQVSWDVDLKLKLCQVLSNIQCGRLIAILYSVNDNDNNNNNNNTIVFGKCKLFMEDILSRLATMARKNSRKEAKSFSKRHPLCFSAPSSSVVSVDDNDYGFLDIPSAINLKVCITAEEINELVAWVYTCFVENYDSIALPNTSQCSDAPHSDTLNWSSAFPTLDDHFSDPFNLRGVLATTQMARAFDYFSNTNSNVFDFLSGVERLSSRLPIAVAKLTCGFLQFPSASLKN